MSSKNESYNYPIGKLIFGKYKVIKLIGIGSFSYVFQGINIKTKKKCCFKI